jgi:hypothetical protein
MQAHIGKVGEGGANLIQYKNFLTSKKKKKGGKEIKTY